MECGDEQGNTFINAKAAYEYTYGKPIEEEKPEVAPVQPKRVEAPKVEKPKKEKKPEKHQYVKEVEEYHRQQEEPEVVEEVKAVPIEEPETEEQAEKPEIDSKTAREHIEIALGALENGSFTQCEEHLRLALEEVEKLKEEMR